MHVVVAGCGRVGAMLATTLDADGHTVAVIDKDPMAFRRLDDSYGGAAIPGIVFDPGALEQAGIRKAQAFVAVTSGDNSNVVSARVAKDRYHVERVVARIYDPERAMIFERLGIVTVAAALWTAEEILRSLLPAGERADAGFGVGDGDVVLLTFPLPRGARAVDVGALHRPGHWLVGGITREGRTTVPAKGALLQGDDEVHVVVHRDEVDRLREVLDELAKEPS